MRPLVWWLSSFLLAVPAIAAGQAEDTGNAASPNAVLDKLMHDMEQRGLLGPVQATVPAVCSVPLVEMAIPTDKRYTMKKLTVTKDPDSKTEVPFSAMPAPPCSPKPNASPLAR